MRALSLSSSVNGRQISSPKNGQTDHWDARDAKTPGVVYVPSTSHLESCAIYSETANGFVDDRWQTVFFWYLPVNLESS